MKPIQKSPIDSHPCQKKLWLHPARFKVLVAGRRFGKTVYLRERLCANSEGKPGMCCYMAPTRMQAKSIMWEQLKARVDQLKWSHKINESELKINRRNGSIIQLFSGERPARARGLGVKYWALDEYAEYRDATAWPQVIRPTLSDTRGSADFGFTPKGFNHGYDLFNNAKTALGWAAFQFKTIDSPFFQTPEGLAELAEAKKNLSERDYNQEYNATFENFAGRIYYAFDRAKCSSDAKYDKDLPLLIGMDFNKSPSTAAICQKFAGVLHQIDEIFLQASDTPELSRTIRHKYPDAKEIRIRPDATGSRSYSVNKNLSDHHILREHGFIVDAAPSNPSRVDRWASTNRAFEKGYAKINVSKCPRTVKDYEVICFKEGSCEPMLNDPMLGHIGDASDYNIYKEFPILGKATQSAYA